MRMYRLYRLAAVAALAAAFAAPAAGAAKKKKPSPSGPQAVQSTGELFGPPAPKPLPLLRAAGTCVTYEPGQFIVLAEVGSVGRTFRVDRSTELQLAPGKGTRMRILYVEGPEGPVARKILPGPVETGAPALTAGPSS